MLGEKFELISIDPVKYSFTLPDKDQISQLLAMTPHGWRINQAARDRLAELNNLELTLDVSLARFKRH